jgi:hypothetical protein
LARPAPEQAGLLCEPIVKLVDDRQRLGPHLVVGGVHTPDATLGFEGSAVDLACLFDDLA